MQKILEKQTREIKRTKRLMARTGLPGGNARQRRKIRRAAR
jgi:hypothetical protein